MVWCGVVKVAWNGVVWCSEGGVEWCGVIWCGCCTIKFSFQPPLPFMKDVVTSLVEELGISVDMKVGGHGTKVMNAEMPC